MLLMGTGLIPSQRYASSRVSQSVGRSCYGGGRDGHIVRVAIGLRVPTHGITCPNGGHCHRLPSPAARGLVMDKLTESVAVKPPLGNKVLWACHRQLENSSGKVVGAIRVEGLS